MHWTKMRRFHEEILETQRREGVRVITPPHALGFLDPGLPARKNSSGRVEPGSSPSKEPSGARQGAERI
jgi:hypothetical protein